MANPLTVFCIIEGESLSNAFEIEIESTEIVATLKSLIVHGAQAPAFRDVAPKDLVLWRVSIPDDNQDSAVKLHDLNDKEKLWDQKMRLSELLSQILDNSTYIVVQRPPPIHATIPEEAVKMLFRRLRGRFRPIISTIEDIINADDIKAWEVCISEREDRLTTASIPSTDSEKRRIEGNLCGELDYSQYRLGQLERTPTEQTRGKEWEFSILFEMVHLFHDKTVPAQLYHNAEPPHSMFQRKAAVVGWTGLMRTTSNQEMTMADFLDAHINNNSEQDGQPVPPFFFPEEHVSGPDVVFVIRFSGLAPDDTLTSSSTPSPGSASFEMLCPVLVQLKHCEKLSQSEMIKARGTVQPEKIKDHGVELSQYCRPHGHYISLVVSYPVEIAGYVMDKPLEKHKDGVTEIALTIDDSNSDVLFSEKHVHALNRMKQLAAEMAETTKEVERRRGEAYSHSH
ncbi:hypothetical protein BGZ99_007884 [Dissophora globulifera]|uniref:Crinkler effector protein N-terminal domain-containing protein n=1 Tax=Dissophora globulifera TaxID=979702 RepID=A0A9P6UQ05_9FUNG|nr:hypothetical protein BGZ99_007884 [Dissophora globulifera]